MTRRSFLLKSATVSLMAAAVFSGCSSTVFNRGKSALPKYTTQVAEIDAIRLIWENGVEKVCDTGSSILGEEDFTFTLPWYIGPNVALTQDDYEIAKYSNSDLLFPGFGLRGRLKYYIAQNTGIDPEKGMQAVQYFLRRFATEDPERFFLELRSIYPKTPEVIIKNNVDREAEDLAAFFFQHYIELEKKAGNKIPDLKRFVQEFPFYYNGSTYRLSIEDFKPYALAVVFIKHYGRDFFDGAAPIL